MSIHLEYYRIFYSVVQEGSITGAANVLNISQPAVSQSIRQLEEGLGVKLFLRAPKGIRLTAEGNTLYEYVRKGYETILLGEATLSRMLGLEQGEIRIGASDMTLKFFLLPFLEEFHEKYPKIKVHVTNGPTPEALEGLREGKIDFCVVSEPFRKDEEIQVREVKLIRDIFVAGSRFQSLKNCCLQWHVLQELPVICLENNTSTREYTNRFLAENGVRLQPEFELATSDMIVQFALRNLGIGAVVEPFAKQYLESGELFELSFAHSIPPRHLCVVTDKRAPLSKAAEQLLNMLP
jgi:DNA-binding transcriptional LysR family regulator